MAAIQDQTWQDGIKTRTGSIAAVGYAALAIFVGGFGTWALTAPLGGATIAPGTVAAAGENVMIQHLDGGIIKEVVRHEGDRVHKGDPLLILDSTVAKSQVDRLLHQLAAKRAEMAVLAAERDDATEVEIPPSLRAFPPELHADAIFAEQRRQFQATMARFKSEQHILVERVEALEQSLDGLRVQKQADEKQLSIVKEEADRKEKLLNEGLTSRDNYTALLRSAAELTGQEGALEAQIASTASQLGEARAQIERVKTSRVEDAVTKLNQDSDDVADLEQ